MKSIALAYLFVAAAVQAAPMKMANNIGPKDPVQQYWENEGWGGGFRFYGNIEYSAKDMDALSEKVQKTMTAAGAKLTNVNTMKPEQQQVPQRPRARRKFMFKVPVDRVEEITAKLSELAPLDSYNVNSPQKGMMPDPAKEIQERLDALNAEMEQNKEALKGMPIARALYGAKIDRLKRAQDSLGDDAQLSVSVTQAEVVAAPR